MKRKSYIYLLFTFNKILKKSFFLRIDCGAGIGRVSSSFLLKKFEKVDIVEQNPSFVAKAKEDLEITYPGRVDKYITQGLQDFAPEIGKYDLIWAQWVLGHLKDGMLVSINYFNDFRDSHLHKCMHM